MSARIWDGIVNGDKVCLDDRAGFRRLVESLNGKAVQVTLEPLRMTRSSQQNRYYWAVIIATLAEECGYEREEMHEALKAKFLRDREGEEVAGLVKIRSTAALDTREFGEYCEQCRRLAAEMGIVIPDPC